MADKYLGLDGNGQIAETEATVTSAGAADAGEIVALDAGGKLDSTLFPSSVGVDERTYEFTETASAGAPVNIFDDAGTAKVRLADASNGRQAHGYSPEAVTMGANGTVVFEGEVPGQVGLTIGAPVFLSSTPGEYTQTPITASGEIHQKVGTARDATTIDFEPAQPITRA